MEGVEPDKIYMNMGPKLMMTGKDWSWTGFSDYLFGKLIVCLKGSCFVAGAPLQSMAEDIELKKASITDAAEALQVTDQDNLVDHKGCCCFLRAGDGALIPPGYIIYQCMASHMGTNVQVEPDTLRSEGSLLLVPCFLISLLLFFLQRID